MGSGREGETQVRISQVFWLGNAHERRSSQPRRHSTLAETADSSRSSCASYCAHWTLSDRPQLPTCHGHGNSLIRIDPQQIEGLALQRGRLGADGDRGLVLGGQHDPVQGERGEVPQQGPEAVGGPALRSCLGGGYCRSALRPTLHHIDPKLVRCATRRFKSVRQPCGRAEHWLGRIARRDLDLFAQGRLNYGQGLLGGAG